MTQASGKEENWVLYMFHYKQSKKNGTELSRMLECNMGLCLPHVLRNVTPNCIYEGLPDTKLEKQNTKDTSKYFYCYYQSDIFLQ